MIKLTLLTGVLTTLGLAQSPLTTLIGGTNQGNVGGGIYFNLQVNQTLTISRIDFRCGANTVAGTGTLNVYLGPSTYENNITNPSLWALVASATTTVAPSTESQGILNTPFALAAGNYAIALQSNAFSHGYTNGVGCTSNTTPGACTNSLFSNADLTLRAGAAQNLFLSGSSNSPRVFNGAIHYTPGGTPIRVASWEALGAGCYGYYRSFYQIFANPVGLNLGNANPVRALRLALRAGSYTVMAVNSPVVPPTSPRIPLNSGNETFLASSAFPNNQLPFQVIHPLGGINVSTADLEVSTEGYIVPRPATLPNDVTPTVSEFLQLVPRWCAHWKNMDPFNPVSSMHVELDAVNSAILVTWLNVVDNALTTTSTFQVAFYQTGDVEFRYGTMSQNGGGTLPVVIGWTEGNNSLDPGNFEIVTSLPFDTEPMDNPPLGLTASARPILGTTVNLVTDSIPAGTLIGAIMLGGTQLSPPLDLAVIQMPGCFLHLLPDVTFGFPVSGATFPFPVQIPNQTHLNGGRLYWQSLTVSAGFNAAGLLSSNGMRLSLGSL